MPTKIEWTDEVWNPTTGCNDDVISPGCEHCYARRMANRLAGRYGYPRNEPFRVTTHPDRLDQPLRWRKPRRVFVDSMGDLFHDDVPDDFIAAVFGVMAAASQHTFMVLTKRPERMAAWFKWLRVQEDRTRDTSREPTWLLCKNYAETRLGARIDHMPFWPLPNVMIGVTAEDQQRADERWQVLRQIPAAVHWLSCEPLLSDIWMNHWEDLPDWIVAGAETGPGARPMGLEWARRLHAKCRAAGVPFFFKKASPGQETPPDLAIREWPEVRNG
jgi:protein gp37